MSKKNIFITGITGCVGHYLFPLLADNPNYKLHLMIRNPQKANFDLKKNNVEVIQDNFSRINKYSKLLKNMDYAIHIATCWGGKPARRINVDRTMDLFSMLDSGRCQKIIYFSTASILGENNTPSIEAFNNGTGYVKTKYQCYKEIQKSGFADKVYTVFPTLIFGGAKNKPYSHVSQGIKTINKYLWLLRYFSLNSSFNFIHAHDIALITRHILENNTEKNDFILGNSPTGIDQIIETLCEINQLNRHFKIDLTGLATKYLPVFLAKKISPWQKYCLKKRHFIYNSVNTQTFGLESPYTSLEECLKV